MLRHEWTLPEPWGLVAHQSSTLKHSLKWLCVHCGAAYAQVLTYRPHLAQFRFIHGLCSQCEGNRFGIPGSLETTYLMGWRNLPLEVLRYQLSCELRFLSHPDHPHNQGLLP